MHLSDARLREHVDGGRALEEAAIAFVLEQEAAQGRLARDVRGTRTAGDVVSGDRTVEVRAFATTVRGEDLWLEARLYDMARAHPDRFWLYVVEDVGQGDPARFRLLRLGGETLQRMLDEAPKRSYYAVPVPVADEVAEAS